MPSNKRKIQYLLDDEYYSKFKIIMNTEKRKSESSLSQFIIEKYIDDYEKQHGTINTKNNVTIGENNNGNININQGNNNGNININQK